MNESVRSQCKATFSRLRELGMKDGLNAANITYLNNQLIRKSPFAPYFRALGLSRGHQLHRTFYDQRSHRFLEAVQKIYYLHAAHEVDPTLADIPAVDTPEELWALPVEQWGRVYEALNLDFWSTIREISRARKMSQGRTEVYKETKQEDIRLMRQYMNMPEDRLLHVGIVTAHRTECTAYALALLVRGLYKKPEAQEFLIRRREDIVQGFVSNAAWRFYLAIFHNAEVLHKTSTEFSNYYVEDGWVENITGGISHKELNVRAAVYQQKLGEILHALWEWRPIFTHDVMNNNVMTTGTINAADIPEEIVALAENLSYIHGQVKITSEASGRHLYIPDPELIAQDGEKELFSKHMAINADKYFGFGQWDVDKYPTKENQELYRKYRSQEKEVPCAMSMKTGKRASVGDLLHMLPLEKRLDYNLRIPAQRIITGDAVSDKHLVYDADGNLIPELPGKMVGLTMLPEAHPALEYLRQRGINPLLAERQYGVTYCSETYPEDRSVGRVWSRLPGGFKNSPRGRLIFPMQDANGVCRGWQARAIDVKDKYSNRWFWTDQESWLQIDRDGKDLFVTEEDQQGFKRLRKYLNARGMARNSTLFGIYQAIQFTESLPEEQRICYLVEGVMDALKGGPPCIAILGKSLSNEQAAVIREHFTRVVVVADVDAAGESMARCIAQRLEDMPIEMATLPEGKKDLGDCSYEEAEACLKAAAGRF